MRKERDIDRDPGERKGKFTDAPDLLMPLFADPDGRGERRWREVFGHRKIEKQPGPFMARKESKKP